VGYALKNVDEKCLQHLKNIDEKIFATISKMLMKNIANSSNNY
jgi:hypothetical protein